MPTKRKVKRAVTSYLKRALEAGIRWQLAPQINDVAVELWLFGVAGVPAADLATPDFNFAPVRIACADSCANPSRICVNVKHSLQISRLSVSWCMDWSDFDKCPRLSNNCLVHTASAKQGGQTVTNRQSCPQHHSNANPMA